MFKSASVQSTYSTVATRHIRQAISPTTDNWDWQQRASCRTMSSDTFFFADGERGESRKKREALAKEICSTCPVILECRRFASKASAAKFPLVVLHILRSMWETIGSKLLSDICLYCLNYFMSSVAVLLWICAVSTLACAHDDLFSL